MTVGLPCHTSLEIFSKFRYSPLSGFFPPPRPCESPSSGQTARSRLKLGSFAAKRPYHFFDSRGFASFAGTFSLLRLCVL